MKITRVLRVTINGLTLYEENSFSVNFTNLRKAHLESNAENLHYLFSSVSAHRVLAFAGINSSGKTMTLKSIGWLLGFYLCNTSVNTILKAIPGIERVISFPLETTIHFLIEGKVYFIRSYIVQDDNKNRLVFSEEEVFSRKVSSRVTKENLFNLDFYDSVTSRSRIQPIEKTYLEDDKSIAKKYIPRDDDSLIADLSLLTDRNTFEIDSFDLDPSIYKYLDPSLEYIKLKDSWDSSLPMKDKLYSVKFVGSDEILLTKKEIYAILSSGTRKGLHIFSTIKEVFENGGYLIIDEIENHFNKSIVLDILKLFRSKKSNPKAATLIMSTHYTEILDDFDRDDSILILSKSHSKRRIICRNMAEILERSDIKKSDIYFSNTYNIGTAINYDDFMNLYNYFQRKSIEKSKHTTESLIAEEID